MSRLFKRGAKVTAYRATPGLPGGFIADNPQFFDKLSNAIEITDLRIQCEIEKSTDKEPNKCAVTITNLNPQSRVNLTTKPLIVRIDAGYDGVLRHVFLGDMRYGYSYRDGTEWLTKLEIADGDRAYRYAQVARTFRKGTSVITAVTEAAKAMGLKLDGKVTASQALQSQFVDGHSMYGNVRDELDKLLAPYGYHWSIQDGKISILLDNEANRPNQAVIVSSDTGMIESPEFSTPEKAGKSPTLKVKMALYPELTPGELISVQALAVQGTFRVEKVTHNFGTGDDDDWISTIEAKALR